MTNENTKTESVCNKRKEKKRRKKERKKGEWTEKVKIKTKTKFLAVAEAYMAISWPTLTLNWRTFVSSGFSTDGTLISASAAPTAGQRGGWGGEGVVTED